MAQLLQRLILLIEEQLRLRVQSLEIEKLRTERLANVAKNLENFHAEQRAFFAQTTSLLAEIRDRLGEDV